MVEISIPESVRDSPIVMWNTNRKSYVADRSVSVPMTSSDLERRVVRGKIFSQISIITHERFDIE